MNNQEPLSNMDKMIAEANINNVLFRKSDVISILTSKDLAKCSHMDLAMLFATVTDQGSLNHLALSMKYEKQTTIESQQETV